MRRLILVVIGCAAVLAYGSGAFAFHSGGTLVCSACHTMHYSQDGGVPVDADAGGPWTDLLKTQDSTDLCLDCHGGVTANFSTGSWGSPAEYAPIVEDPTNDFPGGRFASGGLLAEGNRHNPVGTVASGWLVDGTLTDAPGGTFAAADLKCSSCHDAHGNANFRILVDNAGGGSAPAPVQGTDAFETLIDVSTPSWSGESNSPTRVHNGYQDGMSAWCGNCHGVFHATVGGPSPDWTRHPSGGTNGAFPTAYTTNYGTTAADYDYNIPFQGSLVSAADTGYGAATTSRSFCLSCHRAHGTAYADIGRFDFTVASGSGTNCNKCHGK
ncbi:MAG: hypothetical protein GTO40_25465 [Deltaproteobacteria bacterium]|nr:hypothetical protein [Deltaproteobacteria bacterium]